MADLDAIFRGKRITQMGLGLLGRGVGDAAFLARHGADLLVTDQKGDEALAPSLTELREYPITYRLGEHLEEDFTRGDLILKGAGVPLRSPYIEAARTHGVPVDMSASLFSRIAQIPLVGVTGTRGKSTVTHLIHAMLEVAGKHPLLGGNVRGVSNLELLERVRPESIGVFELDSWQCQGFAEDRSLAATDVRQGPHSPTLAVFTTFMSDHMNYYGGDMEAYLADKAHIFLYQKPGDTLVIGRQTLASLEPYRTRMEARVIEADGTSIPNGWRVRLQGEHNRYNVGVAIEAARVLGVPDDVIRSVVERFGALPGRMEYIGSIRGVPIYNDTNATTPDATVASLRTLDPEGSKRVVLIMGGADKTLDMTPLLDAAQVHTKAVILLKGTGTGKLQLHGHALNSHTVDTLEEAFSEALAALREGDVLLFSPAFASFGMFANEYERGERFVSLAQTAGAVYDDATV